MRKILTICTVTLFTIIPNIHPAFGAIAFDAATTASQCSPTSLTTAHTVTGANPILWVGFMQDTSDLMTSIKYNGVDMTQVDSNRTDTNNILKLFYLTNPATGGANLVTVTSAARCHRHAIASYSGAAQSGVPDQVTGTNLVSQTSSSQTLNNVAANSWTLMAVISLSADPAAGAGTTNRAGDGQLRIGDSNAVVSGTTSLAYTESPADNWGVSMISFTVPATNYPNKVNTITPGATTKVNNTTISATSKINNK